MVIMRSSSSLLLLVGMGLAAVAGLGAACAAAGHTGVDSNEAGGTGGGGGSGGTSMDAGGGGCTVPAPTPLGISVFNDSCPAGSPPTVDWSDLRRVSRLEYDNMVRDLLGDTTQPALNFDPESGIGLGVNLQANTYAGTSSQIVTQYLTTAEALAKTAASNLPQVYSLNGIATCASNDDACAQAFINAFALRAFRGELDSTESSQLFALYQNIADAPNNFGFTVGIQAVITSILSSPWFLYVVELGDGSATQPGAAIPLSQYEIAARLAFFLWRSVPDAPLMTAAGTPGMLSTPAQIQAQAQRMLTVTEPSSTGTGTSLKALDAVNDFATQWLEIAVAPSGKDPIFGPWADAGINIGPELKDETLLNYSQLVLAENGGLTELLTSASSYVSSTLATFYGATQGTGTTVTVNDPSLTGVGDAGVPFVQTSLPNRAGILTNGSILAIQSHALLPSSVLRGKMIREDILCDPIPNPPPNVPPIASSVADGGTTRELFQEHADPGLDDAGMQSICYGCHHFMDYIAFGLGHYDATGAYQAFDQNGADAGPVLDVTGTIFPVVGEVGGLSATFNGATDPTNGVVAKIAGSTQANECFALQQFRYSLSRLESASDACSMQQLYSAFTAGSLNIQKLMIAIVGTDAFRYRSANDANGFCQPGEAEAGSACQ
jgi:hypothetical protein